MDIFEFKNYRKFVNSWIKSQPQRGRGQLGRMAKHCGLSSVYISQVFKGDRQLSLEQAHSLADYLNLLKLETKYFLLLVRYDRAGDFKYKKFLEEEINEVLQVGLDLKTRIKDDVELSEDAKISFYSHWAYSAIRLLSSIPGYQSAESISQYLKFPLDKTKHMMEFLVIHGLCKMENGKLVMGPQKIHLSSDSPLANSRHASWRLKGMEAMGEKDPQHLYFTAPMSLSRKDKGKIKKKLIDFIEELYTIVGESKEEEIACINIDWFNL